MDVESQLDVLCHGTAEVVQREALRQKLVEADRTHRPLTIKLGLDPTAPDIHLGHTVVLEKLRQFQQLGHQVVLLIGDFTGRVGDPTDRSATRKQLTSETVERFARTYVDQAARILDRTRLVVRYNSEWLAPLNFSQLIQLMAQMTLARVLEREDFHRRFSEHLPLHLHELLYPLMQGYDSVALMADVELGGTDQRFNIMTARQIQEAYGQTPEVAILLPILEGTDGMRKMSKSAGNYIGIMEPPLEMYGKVMSIPDSLIDRWGTLLLGWHHGTHEALHPRDRKAQLAAEIVARFWGQDQADIATQRWDATFRQGQVPEDAQPVGLKPEWRVGVSAIELVAALPGVPSKGEARRLLSQGAVMLNGLRLSKDQTVSVKDQSWIRLGRHRFFRVQQDER